MPALSPEEIDRRLNDLEGWRLEDGELVREFVLASFADAIAFLVRVAFGAEASDHHPDVAIRYRRITFAYSTHSAGGITIKDFEGARMVDACASAHGDVNHSRPPA